MTDTATAVAAAPLIASIAPYAVALIPVLIAWGVAEFRKATGVNVSAGAVDKLDALAKAEAGALVAASATNLAGVAIPVRSTIIAGAVTRIVAAAPGVLADAGLTPDAVATMVAGHIGALQASAPAAAAPKS
jgi:hypothetical protein